ncbi:MAG: hypothetical protein HOP07_14965 [Bacteriovoracaceae bacterium]|nr:hypothetical protein [Bacteriovoracaceae bacterium]
MQLQKYGEIEFFDPSFKLNGLTSVKRKVVLNILEISTTGEVAERSIALDLADKFAIEKFWRCF